MYLKKGYAEKKAMIAFNYGSCNTEFIYNGKTIKQTKGIAHFLEHKMFDGSADIFSEFEKLGQVPMPLLILLLQHITLIVRKILKRLLNCL